MPLFDGENEDLEALGFPKHLLSWTKVFGCSFFIDFFLLHPESKIYPVDNPQWVAGKYGGTLIPGEFFEALQCSGE